MNKFRLRSNYFIKSNLVILKIDDVIIFCGDKRCYFVKRECINISRVFL